MARPTTTAVATSSFHSNVDSNYSASTSGYNSPLAGAPSRLPTPPARVATLGDTATQTLSLDLSDPTCGSTVTSVDKPFVPPYVPCPPFAHPRRPESPPREHFRDVRGPVTLHRIFMVLFLAGSVIGLYLLQNIVWPASTTAPRERDALWASLGIIWLFPIPSAIAWIVGALMFRHNTKLDDVQPMDHRVVLRIVSRGSNADCLVATIRACQTVLQATALFPYLIEVVTDGDCFTAPADADVLHTRVPAEYAAPNGAIYKARALHYASQYSAVPGDCWVLHLDEESTPTTSALKGVAAAVTRCELRGDLRRVGQGCILYHRGWKEHPFLTLADMRRTGDDVGHFHLQHRLGWTVFGLHGSYVLARQDVETELGFDVGPRGSITEDAWWVLLALRRGVRPMWVDGYVEEQCTQSLTDFLKQRRRWYVGLLKVCSFCPVPIHVRLCLWINTVSWFIVPIVLPLQILYLVLSIVYQKHIIAPVRVLTHVAFVTSVLVYLAGLVINMREHRTPWYRGVLWMALTLVLVPVFFTMEAVAIVMAIFAPLSESAKGFHVVQKSGYADGETESVGVGDGGESSGGTVENGAV